MISDVKTIEKLYDCFMARWMDEGRTVDEAFAEMHAEAGAVWTPKDAYNRVPDREGRDGSWHEVDGQRFILWKMTHAR